MRVSVHLPATANPPRCFAVRAFVSPLTCSNVQYIELFQPEEPKAAARRQGHPSRVRIGEIVDAPAGRFSR